MTTQTIECWNCGQELRVRVDKLETARCGNCQQMLAKQYQPKTTTVSANSKERPNIFSLLLGASVKSQFPLILVLVYSEEIFEWMGGMKVVKVSGDERLHNFFIFLACVSAIAFVILILRGLTKRR